MICRKYQRNALLLDDSFMKYQTCQYMHLKQYRDIQCSENTWKMEETFFLKSLRQIMFTI